ncbi:MAG: sigma 54-interacting transcriptional regulator [Desulfomonilaceae bacterium]|nr:sigma 54-interacting transcriptional regulator [Desulfomonilaceae bacterium]
MIDHNSIGRLLLETRKVKKEDFVAAREESKVTGAPLHEILLSRGKVSVDDLIQAITMHVDITLLKEALGMEQGTGGNSGISHPLGSLLERISLLFKMGILISNETNMSSLIELLLREAPTMMNAERATIFLADHQTQELYSHLGVGLAHDQIRIPWQTGIAGWVFTHAESLNIADPYKDPRFNKGVDPRTGYTTKSLLCVPLRCPGGPTIGVFQVLNKRAGVFTTTDLEILEILASQAARAMEHAIEWDHLRQKASLLKEENVGLKTALRSRKPFDEIVGNADPMQDVRALIRKVAPTDTTVLIQGESGTGKELVARTIQRLSRRADEPFISLNCAAVPSELIESELFGHKKGSFTGSIADHKGVFRAAHRGTLFLDEIEAMSPAMQVKLLRALQMGEIRPVGESSARTVDVRVLAATNSDLPQLIDQGRFREDLFYRINVFPITIPPLRERPDDIHVLVSHFLDKLMIHTGKVVKGIDPAALDLLMCHPWPGNIRELENEIERAHILTAEGGYISVRCLSPRITKSLERVVRDRPINESPTLKEAVEELEMKMVEKALEQANGNRSLAAKQLGLSRQGLINKIQRYGLTCMKGTWDSVN